MSVSKTLKESKDYAYHVDTTMGVGWFERKSDEYVTLLETGEEVAYREMMLGILSDSEFNLVAKQQTYVSAEQDHE